MAPISSRPVLARARSNARLICKQGMGDIMRRLLLAASALLAVSAATQAGSLDFSLTNGTGYDIDTIYVDEGGKGEWITVDLGGKVLEDGLTASISFTGEPENCKWDLRVKWSEDYDDTLWQGLNLCNIHDITLQYDRDKDETTAVLK